ncbi:hypothetical protein Fot_19768 [Forsythia ovata]|uniref:Uncharacterized protein n=1 Tax=Forsythia ovata TaxID=205694 RepID=A0ABD1VLZ1_9LAMI
MNVLKINVQGGQVCPYNCSDRTSDQCGALGTVEEVGPSSFSEKFSNVRPSRLRRYFHKLCEAFWLSLKYTVRLYDQDAFARYTKLFDQHAFIRYAKNLFCCPKMTNDRTKRKGLPKMKERSRMMPKRAMEDENDALGSRRDKRSRMTPPLKTGETITSP